MKTLSLILCLLGLLITTSCKKEEIKDSTYARNDFDKEVQRYKFENNDGEILRNGIMTIVLNDNLQSYFGSYYQDTTTDEYIYLKDLKIYLSSLSMDLEDIMVNSLLEWGSNPSDTTRLKQILDSVTYSDVTYYPAIYIPYGDIVNYEASILVSHLDSLPLSTSSFIGHEVEAEALSSITINQSIASSRPTFLMVSIKANPSGGEDPSEALPWRRCYCSRSGGPIDDNEQANFGTCSQSRSDHKSGNACGYCGRSNFGGDCSMAPCPAC